MKVVRKIIQIDEEKCDGCGNCILTCAEGALAIVDGKAKVISDNLCDGLGACLGDCPRDALHIIEREADEFDEAAVEVHLQEQQQDGRRAQGQTREKAQDSTASREPLPCGCPSTRLETFSPCARANAPTAHESRSASALTHWPVQIRLIPPNAPFLKGADLLVAADCAPLAFPDLHREFLKGKTVMIGCPKFDDAQSYVDKFAAIFSNADIKSITTVIMEVPCCAGLPHIVRKGLEKAGRSIPMSEVVVSTRGAIIAERRVA